MTDTAALLWGVVFGAVGLGYFVYGRKQRAVVPLLCGVALMVMPYLIGNVLLLVGIGIALAVVPFAVRF